MCGTYCWTGNRLVVCKLNIRIQPARRPQGKKAPKRLDVSKLKQASMRQTFTNGIYNHLGVMNLNSEDPEENWTVFANVVHSSAATTLGRPSRKHQDENDEEIKSLLEENTAFTRHIKMILALYPRRRPTAMRAFMVLPMVPMVDQYRLRFYQWYHW